MAVSKHEASVLDAFRAARAEGRPLTPDIVRGIDGLFAEAQGRVYWGCRRIVGDEERALELAQEALLVGYRKLETFRGEGKLATWLYGIGVGLARNAVRRRGELLSEDGVMVAEDVSMSALGRMRRAERSELIESVVGTLAPEDQEVVFLRYVEQLPRPRIEEMLGMSKGGARVVLQRSKRALQRALAARLAELGHGDSFLRRSL